MALTRDTVVDAATRILREYGLADLTMRRLARELGVQPGALYWHVADKQDLLVAVTEGLLAKIPVHDNAVGLGAWLTRTLLPVPDAADVVRVALAWRPEVVSALAAFEELAGLQEWARASPNVPHGRAAPSTWSLAPSPITRRVLWPPHLARPSHPPSSRQTPACALR